MSNMAKPRFVFLLLREHPYGREMLRQLLSAGHSPVLIIEEDSPVADEEREKFLERIAGNEIAPTIEEQALRNGLARELILFSMVFMATKDILYSILMTAGCCPAHTQVLWPQVYVMDKV